jgi:LytS/YehU family sensor histidine kinase
MHADVNRADRMLGRLSELLRMTLANIERQEVRLAEEIAFVEAYLDIERERFGGQLKLELDLEPQTLEAQVPALFLQPLVENCVRHGFTQPGADSVIVIRAARRGDVLAVSVRDNGRGIAGPMREGVGLANARQRLRVLYGDAQSLAITADRGVTVAVELPYHLGVAHEQSHAHTHADRGRRALGSHTHPLAAER